MNEIRYINRNNLDVYKYDACIDLACNTRVYALSWYLDIVADNWDVLVYGDYEIVMPIPWRNKYFIKYIYTPYWVQQLGIFSKNELKENQILFFIQSIPKKFKKISILLNEQNVINYSHVTTRTNFILNLDNLYKNLENNYQKNRKQSLQKAKNFETQIVQTSSPKNILAIYKENILPKTNIKTKDIANLEQLLSKMQLKEKVIYYESIYNGQIIGGAIFLHHKNRYYYLLSAVNEEGKNFQAMSLIIDEFIKNHANTNNIFDFEGSNIPGIASFFKSFGAKKISYYFYQKPFKLF